jgi:hypothetical protein
MALNSRPPDRPRAARTPTTSVPNVEDVMATAHCAATASRHRLHAFGQTPALRFVTDVQDLTPLDFAHLKAAFEQSMAPLQALTTKLGGAADKELRYEAGAAAIHRGEVAALVLSSGQGTRLGLDRPEGLYGIGLPSVTSLFEPRARPVGWVSSTGECPGHWSPSAPGALSRAPDGNGGIYRATRAKSAGPEPGPAGQSGYPDGKDLQRCAGTRRRTSRSTGCRSATRTRDDRRRAHRR